MTILERIQSYLENGGFFNPEMMEHEKVGRLLLDIRDSILPRPIETAPKDVTPVLTFDSNSQTWEVCQWSRYRGCWLTTDLYEWFPTHWLPLPPAP